MFRVSYSSNSISIGIIQGYLERERERGIKSRNRALIAIINYVIVNEVKYEKSFEL